MAALMCSMNMNAQLLKVMKGDVVVATYTADQADKFIFEDMPASTGPEYVEIGGIKWATMNLGATTVAGSYSTCSGDFYAWGETEPRYKKATWSSSLATFRDINTPYSSTDYPSYKGKTLDAEHDAVTASLGSEWYTPSKQDFKALFFACTGSTESVTPKALDSSAPKGGIYFLSESQEYLCEYMGVAGLLFVSASDNSKRVFFPASGYAGNTSHFEGGKNCYYWSSTLSDDTTKSAYCMQYSVKKAYPASYNPRCNGYNIRPVSY